MSSDTIRIITAPVVRLVGRQTIDEEVLSEFLKDEDAEGWETDTDVAAQKLVEVAGRLCYHSYARPRPGGNSAYIGHILEVGHGSVIEHAVYNFIITGVSRSFTHELVRHRAGFAYSQRSQRFCDEGELSVVVPPALVEEVAAAQNYMIYSEQQSAIEALQGPKPRDGLGVIHAPFNVIEGAGLRWLAAMERTSRDYSYLSDYLRTKFAPPPTRIGSPMRSESQRTEARKQAREAARSVLPNATETQIFVTVNARAARHFIEARGDSSADAEIRTIAVAMLRILQAESPNLFGDYTITPCMGGEVASTPFRKV